LYRSSSTVTALPTTEVEKPHWGLMARPLRREVPGGLPDQSLKLFCSLAPAGLPGDEADYDGLILENVAQGLEATRTLIVVLEEQPAGVDTDEDIARDGLVGADESQRLP
jgi:hypothetical protein